MDHIIYPGPIHFHIAQLVQMPIFNNELQILFNVIQCIYIHNHLMVMNVNAIKQEKALICLGVSLWGQTMTLKCKIKISMHDFITNINFVYFENIAQHSE